MTLKKINPEDLVVGQKYLLEMEYTDNITGTMNALEFNHNYYFTTDQSTYTLEQSSDTDIDLEMLVNVANDIFSASNNPKYTVQDAAVDAYNLITACKNALKEKK